MGPKEQLLRSLVASKGLRYVGTRGNHAGRVVFVGEAPGENEEQQGYPFVGYSGQELDRMAQEAGFSPSDYWLTNPLKVRPPENKLARWDELGIPREPFLDQFYEELETYKPTIIIACGATALASLCPQTIRQTKKGPELKLGLWRASLLESPKLDWPHYVIPMYHPAFILREWSERSVGLLSLARAKEELDSFLRNGTLQQLPIRRILTQPSYDDVLAYLEDVLASPDPVSNDIELMYRKIPHCMGIAKSPWDAISFDLYAYDSQQSVKIWRKLDTVLRTKDTIGQNYLSFDIPWLESIGFSPDPFKVHDTLIRHHVLWPEFEHKLHFQTLQYTRQPYYKDEGRLWRPKDGIAALQRYNGMDCCVTYEIFQAQEAELDERGLRKFYEYEIQLARNFRNIEQRGVLVDTAKLENLRQHIQAELSKSCQRASQLTGKTCVPDKESADGLIKQLGKASKNKVLNLGSPAQILDTLHEMNLKVPIKRGTGSESTGEVQLQQIFAETGNEFVKEILNSRELLKVKGTYVDCLLFNNTLYCSYITSGTGGGRRASRTNVFGYGTNMQNLPKYSILGHMYRGCIIARPGKILINCDQKSAEDWFVCGVIADQSGIMTGLNELRSGINRHRKLASFLFAKPESEIRKDGPEYFCGKKVRHAGNYGMRGKTMSETFAKEGYSFPEHVCDYFLEKFHSFDPAIRNVYHKYVEETLMAKRKLVTPLGRERHFLGLRPFSNNADIFRDAYSYIPQSGVGDNTGLAINWLEANTKDLVIMDDHDAVKLEVTDDDYCIADAVEFLVKAFDRVITFPNGLQIKIPIEIELGYNLNEMVTCDHLHKDGLRNTLDTLRNLPRVPLVITSGVQPQSSLQP